MAHALFLTPSHLGRCPSSLVVALSSEVVWSGSCHTSVGVKLAKLAEQVLAEMPPSPLVSSNELVKPNAFYLLACSGSGVYRRFAHSSSQRRPVPINLFSSGQHLFRSSVPKFHHTFGHELHLLSDFLLVCDDSVAPAMALAFHSSVWQFFLGGQLSSLPMPYELRLCQYAKHVQLIFVLAPVGAMSSFVGTLTLQVLFRHLSNCQPWIS